MTREPDLDNANVGMNIRKESGCTDTWYIRFINAKFKKGHGYFNLGRSKMKKTPSPTEKEDEKC